MNSWFTQEIVTLLGQGLWLTIVLTVSTSLLSIALGVLIGAMRLMGSRWLSLPALLFVEVFRNIPAIILVIFWAFAFPNVFPPQTRTWLFFNNDIVNSLSYLTGLAVPWYVIAAIIGLTLNTAGYIAELFRAGVSTIAREQIDAAQTMGASIPTIFWRILLPGGLRAAYPALTSRLIHNLKNTALASFVSVPEFFNGIQTAITRSFLALEFLTIAALVYLVLAFGLSAMLHWFERRLYPRSSTMGVTTS